MAGWAKQGVKAAGGTPREFTTIAVTDGIAMGYEGMKASLVSREVIADSVELMMMAHGYDALVGIAGCDKSLPGMLMAMARLNVPSVFLYGGTIKPGQFQGHDVTIQDVFEGVGAVEAGRMTKQELYELECAACPGEGSCGGMYTANTMACASEALGMALPYSASIPAADPRREELCRATGETVLRLLEADLKPRDILTKQAFENAIAVVVAIGGSTNAALHLPAIAREGRRQGDARRLRRHRPPGAAHRRYAAGRTSCRRTWTAPAACRSIMKELLDAGLLARRDDGDRQDHRREPRRRSGPGDGLGVILPVDKALEATGRSSS
jgi:dihydroxyacid dehydratase/phosphogluconate dehydratase